MNRIGVVLGLTLSIAMSLCTILVLIRPVFAKECTANCGGGGKSRATATHAQRKTAKAVVRMTRTAN